MTKYWNDKPMSHLEADCLSLLAYVSRHRGKSQTYVSLSAATGIPVTSLRRIILWPKIGGRCGLGRIHGLVCRHTHATTDWPLAIIADKYGYSVRLVRDGRIIIDVECRGWQEPNPERWEMAAVMDDGETA